MTLSTAQITLNATTSTKLVGKNVNPQRVVLHSHDHQSNAKIYIGDEFVTDTTGFHVPDTESLTLILNANEELWAITDTSSGNINVLVQEF